MKLELTEDLVRKMSLAKVPQAGKEFDDWQATARPNHLVYDTSREAPPGFAVRIGARGSVHLVEKMVQGKKFKIAVGLAWSKCGADRPLPLAVARDKARDHWAAACLRSWVKVTEKDPMAVFSAAKDADLICDYMLGLVKKGEAHAEHREWGAVHENIP